MPNTKKPYRITADCAGLTLLEIMVGIAIFGIAMGSIYGAYRGQLRSYVTNQQLAEMQQVLRSISQIMQVDIRMAGTNPTKTATTGITTANANSITLRMDFTNPDAQDGEDDDSINGADDPGEAGGDGVCDIGLGEVITYRLEGTELKRTTPATPAVDTPSLIASNIEAMNFVYLDADGKRLEDDAAGNVVASIPLIRAIQVTLVMRAGKNVPVLMYKYTDNTEYQNQFKDTIFGPAGDQFRRASLSFEVKCKNLS
ncbi:MAG: type II secretion system protein [Desulfobacteraceae bacterium]|nr:type II secretion system protein [Desulfobacteraceae bacterium]